MKRGEIKQLHNKTVKELQVMLAEAKIALFKNKMDLVQNKLKNTQTLREKRAEIARVLTILREKKEEENA